MNVARRVVRVTKTRRAIRAEKEAARKEKVREREIRWLLDGTRDRVLEETGVDLLAGTEFSDQPKAKLPQWGAGDGGAGREQEMGAFDTRTSSQKMSDWIRQSVEERREQREKVKRLPGGIPDARLIPDDPSQGAFEDRNLYGG